MKTSTKLLIIFFSCIPISLMAYNYLLNKEYIAGRFARDYYKNEQPAYQKQPAQAFKHIVINGALKYDIGVTNMRPRIVIEGDTGLKKGNDISILKEYAGILQTRVQNDTLYLSFDNKAPFSRSEMDPIYTNSLVNIRASDIRSVKASNAYITIMGRPTASDSLSLVSSVSAQYDVFSLHINKLNISGEHDSELNLFDQNNNIGNLYYSLHNNSILRLSEHPIKAYHAVNISDSARIEITGKAVELQKRLQ
jgi:hypothetical protein